MITEGNKTKVQKAGLDDEIRDGYDYEVTVALEITNDMHMVRASKDRTNLFSGKPEFVITPEIGKKLLEWCNSGISLKDEVTQAISSSKSINELIEVYNKYPTMQEELKKEFSAKKLSLELNNKIIPNPQNFSTNGQHNGNSTIQQ